MSEKRFLFMEIKIVNFMLIMIIKIGFQDKNSKTYLENGSFYIFNVKKFLKYNCRLFGKIGTYKIDSYKSIQVDEPDDLKIADALLKSLNNCSAPSTIKFIPFVFHFFPQQIIYSCL